MNTIDTQESTRAVVTESGLARGSQTAKQSRQSGEVQPQVETKPEANVQSRPSPSSDRNARVAKAVAQLNDYVQSLQRDLRFSVDQELGRAVVSVVDRTSQEVIRQIPNETALQLARNLKDQAQIQQATPSGGVLANLGLINTRI